MSTELVACPHCGTNLQNTSAIAGQIVACPQCQAQLQMPALAPVGQAPVASMPGPPEPAPELPQPVQTNVSLNVGVNTSGGDSGRAPKAADLVRRRSNPVLLISVMFGIFILIGVGVIGFLVDTASKQREQTRNDLAGNWELVSGQTERDRGAFAFHTDGKFQVLLQAGGQGEVLDGRWEVSKVRGDDAQVLIEWPDGSSETMIVRMSGGRLHVSLPSVGNLTFRASAPGESL